MDSPRINSHRFRSIRLPLHGPRPLCRTRNPATTTNAARRTRARTLTPQAQRLLSFAHLKSLAHTPQKVLVAAADLHNSTDLNQTPDFGTLARDAAKVNAGATLDVRGNYLEQDLAGGRIEGCDAVDVKDQVAVGLGLADLWQGWVRGRRTVVFEAAEPVFEAACVGEG